MGIDTSGIVLFVHIGLVAGGLMLAALLHLALVELWRARTGSEMRPWAPVIRRMEPLLPVVALGILGSGVWLVHLSGGEVRWSDAWIYASLGGLVAVETVGGLLAPVSHRLTEAISSAAAGPVEPALRRLSRHPALWCGAHFGTAEFFGIIFLMSAKPSGVWAPLVALGVAGAVGLGSVVPFVRGGPSEPGTPSAGEDRPLTRTA